MPGAAAVRARRTGVLQAGHHRPAEPSGPPSPAIAREKGVRGRLVEPAECEGSETSIKHQAAFIGSHVTLPVRGILQKRANRGWEPEWCVIAAACGRAV
jgi:hypothetical protein